MNKAWRITLIVSWILISLAIALILTHGMEDNKRETLERCQSKGWDRITVYDNKYICENMSQGERDAIMENQEK